MQPMSQLPTSIDAEEHPLLRTGESVHLIERRLFTDDVRRHFAGVVEAMGGGAFRIRGHLFVYDSGSGRFIKQEEPRTRIIAFDNRVIVNVLPPGVEVGALHYEHDSDGALVCTDSNGYRLDDCL